MGGTLKKMKRSRQIGISNDKKSKRDSYGDYDNENDDDDQWADEINRINHRASASADARRRPNHDSARHQKEDEHYYYDDSDEDEDVPAMEAFARRVLTPRPLSTEPALNLDGSTLLGGDDHYFTPRERQRYEQALPMTSSDGRALSPAYSDVSEDEKINWRRGELLGSGAFGNVYLGLNLDTGELMGAKQISLGPGGPGGIGSPRVQGAGGMLGEYAHRVVSPDAAHLNALQMEIHLMKGLDHDNIVRYWGTEVASNTLTIFMEYVPGGSLAAMLRRFGPFNQRLVSVYTTQLLRGLHYLHSHRIVHRDIKGGNILVDNNGVCKLADFGASKRLDLLKNTAEQSLKGTPYWMAPEVIRQAGYGRQADIWSVGCTVIEMATGRPPWSEYKTQVSVMFHIAVSKEPPEVSHSIT